MPLQPFSQITVRFAQLATSGLLVIQATIATTVIGAFAPINSGWLAASSASAQKAQPTVPMPGSVSTSAMDLKPVPNVSCLLAEESFVFRLCNGRTANSPSNNASILISVSNSFTIALTERS